jgi:hypothetical protein
MHILLFRWNGVSGERQWRYHFAPVGVNQLIELGAGAARSIERRLCDREVVVPRLQPQLL